MTDGSSRFTSDRRGRGGASWTGQADWEAGTAENVDVTEDGLVGRLSTQNNETSNSVVYRWTADDFAIPWTDGVSSVGMSANGLSSSTFSNGVKSVAGNGSDDYGLANGPETIPENETFGVAFTVETADKTDLSTWFASTDGSGCFALYQDDAVGRLGEPNVLVRDGNGNELKVACKTGIVDGDVHLVVINKRGNSASEIDFYVDDMTNETSQNNRRDQGFDHTKYSVTAGMSFYAENSFGSIRRHMNYHAGFFEFRDEPYGESERKALRAVRPEV
ncbi:hypothetical protein [Halorubrum laminariae]|uniref:LamG domain-containing protein n=1 Tax=Halorubrum laminariae TaxID=1433523 RepID=A0ABD6BYK2_9EURY|nr:hypothetical protein [Halorubrum laminariae]